MRLPWAALFEMPALRSNNFAICSDYCNVPGFDPITFGKVFTHRRVVVRNAELHYVEGGSGEPVLLVPGWPQSWYAWRHVMPALADSHHVIAIDPPGLGESETPRGGYDTANIAAYIDAFLDALKLDSVDFAGHDIGAWIGYAYAARHARKVRRLALIDAAIPGIVPADAYALTPERINKTWHFYFNALPELPEALVAGRERMYLSWLFSARATNKSAIDEAALDEYTRVYSAPGAMQSGFEYYRAIFDSIAQNRATATKKLAMPVLAIGGDQWLGPLMQKMVEPVAANLRTEIIPDSGHFVPEEAPAAVIRLLEAFLK
jgi:pimeloyl-ACP methyl ester carboxylesterase